MKNMDLKISHSELEQGRGASLRTSSKKKHKFLGEDHLDALWEVLHMSARAPENFMDASDVNVSDDGFPVTQHADQCKKSYHESAKLGRWCRWRMVPRGPPAICHRCKAVTS